MLRPLTSRDAMLERLQQRVSCRAAVWLASVMIVLPTPGARCRCAEQPGTTCCCSARTPTGPANGRNCCNRRSDLAPAGRPCCCRERAPTADAPRGPRPEAARAPCCLAKAKSVSTSPQTCGGAERCTCCDHESAPPPAIPTGFQPSPAQELALVALTALMLDAFQTYASPCAHGPGAVLPAPSCGLSVQLCHLTI